MATVGRKPGFDIQLLGEFAVHFRGEAVIDRGWGRRKAQGIIKLLALSDRRGSHREELIEQLWPDLEPAAGLNNLHKNLHHIRTELAGRGVEDQLVALRGEMVELAPGTRVDVASFRSAAHSAASSGEIPWYEEAVRLYKGDLLPEDLYEPWAEAEREELRQLYGTLVLELADRYAETGDTAAGIEAVQRLVKADPLNEDAHRLLMQLHAQTGNRQRAVRQFEILRDTLERELGAAPSAETMRIYESMAQPEAHRTSSPDEGATASPPVREVASAYGREPELSEAEAALRAAIDGQGSAVFFRGEAGIGKSHLAEHVLALAHTVGCVVLEARCSQLESSVAYQPIRDILEQASRVPDAGEFIRRSLYLRHILYGASGEGPLASDPHLLQTELFGEMHRLMQTLAEQQPAVIFLDDLHAADGDTIRLVHYLARRISGTRCLLIATYRREAFEQVAAIFELVASLRRDGSLLELDLEPLDNEAMQQLAGQLLAPHPVAPALIEEVIERAEGNPLFAGELIRTFVREGWARLVEGRWERQRSGMVPIPTAVHDLVDLRFRKLSQTAQEELHLAAAMGREFDFQALRQSLASTRGDPLDALDECLEADIVEETPGGYRFRHDLFREAVYSRLSRARRELLHRRLAESFATRWKEPLESPDVEAIARHYALGDEPWYAVPFLVQSARRAASVFANDHAIGLYQQAREISGEHPRAVDVRDQAAAADGMGDLERRRGNLKRGVELFEEASRLYGEAGDIDASSRARGKAALAEIVLGRPERAKELINATLQELSEESPLNVVSRTHYLLAQLHWHSGENRDALKAAERALATADAAGDPAERAQACEVLALACHSLGDWQRGVKLELERYALGVPGFNTDEAFDAHL